MALVFILTAALAAGCSTDSGSDGGEDAVGEDDAAAEDAGPPPECGDDLECAGRNAQGACQVDVCQAGSCTVEDAVDDPVCDDGNACTAGDGCAAGVCTGGAGGCSNPASFQCEACNSGPTCAGTPLPSWSLADVNPTSPTLGQQVAPTAFLGQPVLIYTVHGYCPTCAFRAKELGSLIADVNSKGANAKMIVVNQKEYASNITNVAQQGDFAMVNDDAATNAFGEMGVPSKEYLLIYDKAGKLVTRAAPWEWSVNKQADVDAIRDLLTDLGAQ